MARRKHRNIPREQYKYDVKPKLLVNLKSNSQNTVFFLRPPGFYCTTENWSVYATGYSKVVPLEYST